MRVITGIAKGRKLKEPRELSIRPTGEMVKESVFNIIQGDIEGRRVLDLFAGTGQLGIEALSRGAREAVFVDASAEAVKLVKENLAHCKLEGRVIQGDALHVLEKIGQFDLIFLDPPYASGLLATILQKIQNIDILNDGGIIICESSREEPVVVLQEPYYTLSERNYGKKRITVCGKRAMA